MGSRSLLHLPELWKCEFLEFFGCIPTALPSWHPIYSQIVLFLQVTSEFCKKKGNCQSHSVGSEVGELFWKYILVMDSKKPVFKTDENFSVGALKHV